jgi:CHAT domain-containing protein
MLDMMRARNLPGPATPSLDLGLVAGPPPLGLAQLQRLIPEQSEILEYALVDGKLVGWLVSRELFCTKQVDISAKELTGKVSDFLQNISHPSNEPDERAEQLGRELYTVLLAPFEGLLRSDKQLCIVPDKILNYLPFAALKSPVSGRYLIEDFTISFSPSANAFLAGSELARSKEAVQREALACVGDPAFSGADFPGFPRLRSAAMEAREVARLYGSIPWVGEQATKKRVIFAMARSDVVHLATHLFVDDDSPLLSGLLLAGGPNGGAPADGLLRAFDVYRLDLSRPRLVVLSACQTAIEASYRGEGAIGFARPFIARGVPVVVGSLWKVETDSTRDLMVRFHAYRQKGLWTASALRQAQLDILGGGGDLGSMPYYWAGLVAVGGLTRF